MRAKGIAYDTGLYEPGRRTSERLDSRPGFDADVVRRELTIIRDDLHCTAVQIIGGDPARLEVAAQHASELGLEVWYSPYPIGLGVDEMRALFAECAEHAERLRARGAKVVFVMGVELSVMSSAFLPGDTIDDRVARLLSDPDRPQRMAAMNAHLDSFLREAASIVRARFSGDVTYAAIPFEQVDWELFDIVTLELIRSAEVADRFRDGVRSLVQSHTKPVAVTGFACATWHGAPDVAPTSMSIAQVDGHTGGLRLNGVYQRDERGQAEYLADLLDIFGTEGVDSTFVHLFALHNYPHRPDGDPRDDLDLASPGIVAVLEEDHGTAYPDMPWQPKQSFAAVAAHYATDSRQA
jgi:hypothetical protein